MGSYLKISNCYNISRDQNKKIISFSLYGINTHLEHTRGFFKGIFVNFELAKTVYPGWIIRVYMPDNEPIEFINLLIQMKDIELFLVKTNVCLRALRYLPNDDPFVSVWISRDLDSIVTFREKAAVDDWIMNYPNKELHIMNDHICHSWCMGGGMFGKKNNHEKSLITFMLNFSNVVTNQNEYAVDCTIAEEYFYRPNNYIQHHGHGNKLQNSVPFPAHDMTNCTFVGDIVNIHQYYNMLDIENKYIKPLQQQASPPQPAPPQPAPPQPAPRQTLRGALQRALHPQVQMPHIMQLRQIMQVRMPRNMMRMMQGPKNALKLKFFN